jgi:hypothetical protein
MVKGRVMPGEVMVQIQEVAHMRKKCVTCDLSRKMISLLFLVLPISTYSQHK